MCYSPMCIYKLQFFTFIFAVLLQLKIFKILKASHVLALDGVYLKKKKEVSTFTRSIFTEAVQKLKKIGHVTQTTPF